MKLPYFSHYFILPARPTLLHLTRQLPYVSIEEFLMFYFSNLAFMLDEGWGFIPHGQVDADSSFQGSVSMLQSLLASDVEGIGPRPVELEEKENNLICNAVKGLTWDLLTHIHPECWEKLTIHFVRCVGNDMLLVYHGTKPFRCPDPRELPFSLLHEEPIDALPAS